MWGARHQEGEKFRDMSVNRFLFGPGKLFESQAELAQALIAAGHGFEGKDPQSVRTFISQVLKPAAEKGSRPASPNFKKALREAIKRRSVGEDQIAVESKIEGILSRIDSLKDPTKVIAPSDEVADFSQLLEAARLKSHVVIFTTRPAETRPGKKADILSEILIARAINPNLDTHDPERIRYEFYVVGHAEAVRARNAIIKHTARDMECSDAEAAEYVANAEHAGRLQVFSISSESYIPPICLFDPDAPKDTIGFMLFYHENDRISVACLDQDNIADVYAKLLLPVRDDASGERFSKRLVSEKVIPDLEAKESRLSPIKQVATVRS